MDYHSPRSSFLLKIFFGRKMTRESFVAHIECKREAASSDLALFRGIEDEIKASEWSIFWHAPLRWDSRTNAVIRWCVTRSSPRRASEDRARGHYGCAHGARRRGVQEPDPRPRARPPDPWGCIARRFAGTLVRARTEAYVYRPKSAKGRLPAVLLGVELGWK